MRVICAPDRFVRHPQTLRPIDGDRGILYDPTDLTIARMIEQGDLLLVDDDAAGNDQPAEEAAAPEAAEKE